MSVVETTTPFMDAMRCDLDILNGGITQCLGEILVVNFYMSSSKLTSESSNEHATAAAHVAASITPNFALHTRSKIVD